MLFETAFGPCGLAWNGAGVCAVAFPEADAKKVRAQLLRKAPRARRRANHELAAFAADAVETDAPPEEVARIAQDITALFAGDLRDLIYADLDMSGLSDFDRTVYGLTLEIGPGETKTYGELARAMGDITLSRRIGQSLGRNPFPIIVPCHRVVGAGGAMTGFSAPGGAESKRRLLKIEGALGPDLLDAL